MAKRRQIRRRTRVVHRPLLVSEIPLFTKGNTAILSILVSILGSGIGFYYKTQSTLQTHTEAIVKQEAKTEAVQAGVNDLKIQLATATANQANTISQLEQLNRALQDFFSKHK